jgi:hypothetical protein
MRIEASGLAGSRSGCERRDVQALRVDAHLLRAADSAQAARISRQTHGAGASSEARPENLDAGRQRAERLAVDLDPHVRRTQRLDHAAARGSRRPILQMPAAVDLNELHQQLGPGEVADREHVESAVVAVGLRGNPMPPPK